MLMSPLLQRVVNAVSESNVFPNAVTLVDACQQLKEETPMFS